MIVRLQCAWTADTSFPRDKMMITPHFDIGGLGPSDVDGLCEDLADGLNAWGGVFTEIEVTGYDAQGTPPVYPIGHAVKNPGEVILCVDPREVSLCLSFYAERNIPRRRGRLFLPSLAVARGLTGAVRPATPTMQRAADLVPVLTNLGGQNVDWVVYSRVEDQAHSVTNWFVDNEWDTIRSRGLRPDARLTGTTTEA